MQLLGFADVETCTLQRVIGSPSATRGPSTLSLRDVDYFIIYRLKRINFTQSGLQKLCRTALRKATSNESN